MEENIYPIIMIKLLVLTLKNFSLKIRIPNSLLISIEKISFSGNSISTLKHTNKSISITPTPTQRKE